MRQGTAGVFINVPFDRRYQKLFDALVFAVHDCGFVARGAREHEDSSQVRLEKLYRIIGECRYGIHDLSRVTVDSKRRLPRFNMPLETGYFWRQTIRRPHSSRQVLSHPGARSVSLSHLLFRHQWTGYSCAQ